MSVLHTFLQRLFKREDDEPPPVKERHSLFTELIPVEFFDALSSLPCPINVTEALKRFRQIGRVEGRHEQLPVVYLQTCQKHCTPLREIEPGIFECFLCRLEAQPQSQATGDEHHTEQVPTVYIPGQRSRQWHRSLQETQAVPTPRKYTTKRLG